MSNVVAKAGAGNPRPTSLAAKLGLSRVTLSKLLGALQKKSPDEVLEAIPGPESLRGVVTSAATHGMDRAIAVEALAAIDQFDALIREQFGTRAALHAAIGGRSNTLRARVSQTARADVFKGMRHILGVEAETWLTCMFFEPVNDDPDSVAITNVHGAIAMRRLRSDTSVCFSFGPPPQDPHSPGNVDQSPVSLQQFYANEPATLESTRVGGQIIHTLADNALGKDQLRDMLVVSRQSKGPKRFAADGSRLRGVSLFVDVPARNLVCDAIVHNDIFPSAAPQLIVYNPGARGPANPNDPARDSDRVVVTETVEDLSAAEDRFTIDEIPRYADIINHTSRQLGRSLDQFRVYRLRMAYPVVGLQYVVAFAAPDKSA
ncbi:MAG: hypothetical protein IPK69_00505 [Phycisphaerales bacterium]|nr:MAG: hypothetical protein IPK69_00505 [Phycisphaerales bacterium]